MSCSQLQVLELPSGMDLACVPSQNPSCAGEPSWNNDILHQDVPPLTCPGCGSYLVLWAVPTTPPPHNCERPGCVTNTCVPQCCWVSVVLGDAAASILQRWLRRPLRKQESISVHTQDTCGA